MLITIINVKEAAVKKTKQIMGVLLIFIAIAGLAYWEMVGRDKIMTEKVLVACVDILQGDILAEEMLSVASVIPESVISGAMKPEEIKKALGKKASQTIIKNQQISRYQLGDPVEREKDKRSPYLIKGDWIDSMSSSLRRGDKIEIYNRDGQVYLGDYEVLYVKDAQDKEITDIISEDLSYVTQGRRESGIRDRAYGNGVVDHIEILAELNHYQKILAFVDAMEEKLLIVQKEGER